jgi:hypothetical protein
MEDKVHVSHYKAAWYYGKGYGAVTLLFADGSEQLLDQLDAASLHAVVDLLRNERPLVWSRAGNCLQTLSEMVGEGEIIR